MTSYYNIVFRPNPVPVDEANKAAALQKLRELRALIGAEIIVVPQESEIIVQPAP